MSFEKFNTNLDFNKFKPQGTTIGLHVIGGAQNAVNVLVNVCTYTTSVIANISNLSLIVSPALTRPVTMTAITQEELKTIQTKLKFMKQIASNYQGINSLITTPDVKVKTGDIPAKLIAQTETYRSINLSGDVVSTYANKIIGEFTRGLDEIARSGISQWFGVKTTFRDMDTVIIRIINKALSELEDDAKQYMASPISQIQKSITKSCPTINSLFESFERILTPQPGTSRIELSTSMVETAKEIESSIKAVHDDVAKSLMQLVSVALEAADCKDKTVESLQKLSQTSTKLMETNEMDIMTGVVKKALKNATELKTKTEILSSCLAFISGVTNGVKPLLDDIVIMCNDDNVTTFFSGQGGGGGGRRHGRGKGQGEKSIMTRRNRLRFKKSRVITRRSNSSRLSHLSRLSRTFRERLGTHNKGGKGSKGGKVGNGCKGCKASTTRKLNGGVIVV